MLWLATGVLLALAACSDRPAAVPAADAGASLVLAGGVPFAELKVTPDNRAGRRPLEEIPLRGAWRDGGMEKGVQSWVTDLPVRPRAMFYLRPPEGMAVLAADGTELPFGKGPKTWSFDATTLTVHQLATAPAPVEGSYQLQYPFSIEREVRLNQAFWGGAPETFVRATVQLSDASRSGLLLPAPGVAAWDVLVPAAAELRFEPVLVPPEVMDAPASDGATFVVEVDVAGQTHVLWSRHIASAEATPVRVNLSRWAGQTLRLRFRTEPGPSAAFDYAFFADPVVTPRKADPRRVVMLFVDTLRPDHLGVYGYGRDTTKALDEWAQGAVVFEEARSVAPWTLPSQRSVITGRVPEVYAGAKTLQARLGEQGWATAMLSGNVYLSANFEMERDWGQHRADFFPSASDQVDRSLAWLEAQDGRNALLLVHFMDCHLPYHEPLSYRYRYAAAIPPAALGDRFERTKVVQAKLRSPEDRGYVIDRYDNNVAYVHAEIGRLLNHLAPEDIVVFYSDHGEEFWDHGQFEHGHTLYDELLRVPLIVRAPGVPAGRVQVPVSLLDVTPTILDLLGMPDPSLDGRSLVAAMRGDARFVEELQRRPLAFGRPLYGSERWGTLLGSEKYATSEGVESLYDLRQDPGETRNQLRDTPDRAPELRERLAGALGRPVRLGFRVVPQRMPSTPREDLTVEIEVPGGVGAAWVGEDPTRRSAASVTHAGDRLQVTWPKGSAGVREVFFTSADSPLAAGPGIIVRSGAPAAELRVQPGPLPQPGDERSTLIRGKVGARTVSVGWAVLPLPDGSAGAVRADDAELHDSLKALGYEFDDGADPGR